MTTMKKLLASAIVMMCVYFASAIDATFTIAPNNGAKNSNYINGPVLLSALQFVNNGIANVAFVVYDSPATNSTYGPAQGNDLTHYSNGAYQAVLSYVTNISMTYTGFSGKVTTNTERFLRTFTNTVAATSNEFRRVFQGTIPSGVGQTLTIPIESGVWFSRGFTVSNQTLNTNIQINVTYVPGL